MKLLKCHGDGYEKRGDRMYRYMGKNGPRRVKLGWGSGGRGQEEGKVTNKTEDLWKRQGNLL